MTEKSVPQKGKMPGPIDIAKRTPGEGKLPNTDRQRPDVKTPKRKPTERKTPKR